MNKKCSNCGIQKPISDFYNQKRSKCIDCARLESHANYIKNKDSVLAKKKERYKNIDKEKERARQRTSYKKNRKEYITRHKKWMANNPEVSRNYKLRIKYGISLDDYNKLYIEQDGKCAICRKEEKVLSVDHNHETGKVRKLLCKFCNTALGMVKDNPSILRIMAEYIENHR